MELTDLDVPGGLHSAWIGFKRPSPDISKIDVIPTTTVPPGQPWDNYGIDNIHYNTTVSININAINLRRKSISVAILSSPDFNAPVEVDRSTLTFGPTGNEASPLACTRKSKDVNGDRNPDLVCQFPMKLEGSLPLFDCGDTVGLLKGEMVLPDGRSSFEGQQAVVITPCK